MTKTNANVRVLRLLNEQAYYTVEELKEAADPIVSWLSEGGTEYRDCDARLVLLEMGFDHFHTSEGALAYAKQLYAWAQQ